MANQERGELGVEVDGNLYTLRPTFDALCSMEDLVGKPIDEILAGVDQGRISGIRTVVWVLLQDVHADEIRTLKDASEWIVKAGGPDVVLPKLHELLGLNMETLAVGGAANPRNGKVDGTGAGSSRARAGSGLPGNGSGKARRVSSGTRLRRSRNGIGTKPTSA